VAMLLMEAVAVRAEVAAPSRFLPPISDDRASKRLAQASTLKPSRGRLGRAPGSVPSQGRSEATSQQGASGGGWCSRVQNYLRSPLLEDRPDQLPQCADLPGTGVAEEAHRTVQLCPERGRVPVPGKSEGIGIDQRLFDVLSSPHRIYRLTK